MATRESHRVLHHREPPGADPHAVVVWGPGAQHPRLPDWQFPQYGPPEAGTAPLGFAAEGKIHRSG